MSLNKKCFAEYCQNNLVVLDGATGTNLMKAGMDMGECPERWILDHAEVMISMQVDYIKAGSNVIYAPTFTCNSIKLEEYGLEDSLADYNEKLVELSKEAIRRSGCESPIYIAADLTMTGKQIVPVGALEFEDLIQVYKEQVSVLMNTGVDLFVIETMMSLQETRAAVLAVKETCDLPIMVSMTFESDGRTLYGSDAKTCAIVLEHLGICAIGANCSTGPILMKSIIADMASVASIPILAKPNAGMPELDQDGNTIYSLGAEKFAQEMKVLINAGATIVGGCCGTTHQHIERLVEEVSKLSFHKLQVNHQVGYLTTERNTLSIGLNDPFYMIGERINPTGKKALQASLREGDLTMVESFAKEQIAKGATLLDVNLGMNGIDECAMMVQVIQELAAQVEVPLVIDSSHVEVVAQALRHYPGRALINSISMEEEKMEPLLELAKKYGAMFILLPLSSRGLPKDLEEKHNIIDSIVTKSLAMGMKKEDIIVDGLVTTIATNHKAAVETLQTISYCKEHGLKTVCGLSNISFGLPQRSTINHTFLTLAMKVGLTMAIANPSQKELVDAMITTDFLLGKSGCEERYLTYMQDGTLVGGVSVSNGDKEKSSTEEEKVSLEELMHQAVVQGRKKAIVAYVEESLSKGTNPKEMLNETLIPAINEVGDLYQKGTYFLPQLIASAETMKYAIAILEPLLLEAREGTHMPTIVIATVKGDIHDIGKNLVALMLRNYGFQVIDLGKDVTREEIVETALTEGASIIAMSALMTTTMQEMKRVIAHAKEREVSVKFMIGGAVITKEYAMEIGADGYSKDASEAVLVAKELLDL